MIGTTTDPQFVEYAFDTAIERLLLDELPIRATLPLWQHPDAPRSTSGSTSDRGQTVENQLQPLQEAAGRLGWTVVAIYRDEGISGTRGRDKRPGLDALLKVSLAHHDHDHADRVIILDAAAWETQITSLLIAKLPIRERLLATSEDQHQQVATVYKRNSTYWVRFQWRGKEVRRSAHTTSKATAQQFLAGLLDEHRRLDRGGNPRRTYKEALERFSLRLSANPEAGYAELDTAPASAN